MYLWSVLILLTMLIMCSEQDVITREIGVFNQKYYKRLLYTPEQER